MAYWVRPDGSLTMHALAREVPHGVAVSARALCGEAVHVSIRPWFVTSGSLFLPRDCPGCRVKVDDARGLPKHGRPLPW